MAKVTNIFFNVSHILRIFFSSRICQNHDFKNWVEKLIDSELILLRKTSTNRNGNFNYLFFWAKNGSWNGNGVHLLPITHLCKIVSGDSWCFCKINTNLKNGLKVYKIPLGRGFFFENKSLTENSFKKKITMVELKYSKLNFKVKNLYLKFFRLTNSIVRRYN